LLFAGIFWFFARLLVVGPLFALFTQRFEDSVSLNFIIHNFQLEKHEFSKINEKGVLPKRVQSNFLYFFFTLKRGFAKTLDQIRVLCLFSTDWSLIFQPKKKAQEPKFYRYLFENEWMADNERTPYKKAHRRLSRKII
jgi:hypothetical protein